MSDLLRELDSWLQYAGTPIGQECCGRPGMECCGCPEPVYPTPDQVIEEIASRHRHIQASLRAAAETTEIKGK